MFLFKVLPDISKLWNRISMRRLIPSLKLTVFGSENSMNIGKIPKYPKKESHLNPTHCFSGASHYVSSRVRFIRILSPFVRKNPHGRRESEPPQPRAPPSGAGNVSWCWRPTSLPSAYAPVNGRRTETRFPIGKST